MLSSLHNRFTNFQVLKVANARKWKSFQIAGNTYFAVASNSRNHESPVFKWVENKTDPSQGGGRFQPFQTLSTIKAFDVEPITVGDDVYLGTAIYYGPYSHIFKWDGERFNKFQDIPVACADIESFKINGSVFFATTGAYNTCLLTLTCFSV